MMSSLRPRRKLPLPGFTARRHGRAWLFSLATFVAMGATAPVQAEIEGQAASREARFDAAIDPAEMGRWLQQLSSAPNHVGAPHNKANAEWVRDRFAAWGWDAHIETFWVLYPTPIKQIVEMSSATGARFKANFVEPPVTGDASTRRAQGQALEGYLTYQGDGQATAPLVYVNYGMADDYAALERMGVSVLGKIVIARFGNGWRGVKAKLAEQNGAVGALLYSDPHEDGYAVAAVYPNGPAKPAGGIQHGSVYDQPYWPGDPLTPGFGAVKDAKRLDRSQAPSLVHIPVAPLAYRDAQVLLSALNGLVAPTDWQGSLPLTYRLGGGGPPVHMSITSDWSLKPVYNVIATLKGGERPDSWIIRGNHRDAWVMGATDPLSGQVALLAEAKALGALKATGWRPKRTIVYASWDGEEPALLGSVEWVETHAAELQAKGALYINTDESHRGFLTTNGSDALSHFVGEVAADVVDPQAGVSVGARQRSLAQVLGAEPNASQEARQLGKIAADPSRDMPLKPGTGSDGTAFMYHLGLPTLYVSYDGEGDKEKGAYHSLYDTFEYHSRFVDPGFRYHATTAKTVGRMVLRAADADLPIQRYEPFAQSITAYVQNLKRTTAAKAQESVQRDQLLAVKAYELASDPQVPMAPPPRLAQAPDYDFAPLDAAGAKLLTSARAFDQALLAKGGSLDTGRRNALDALLRPLDQRLLSEDGLPGRPWYRNLIFATGRASGRGGVTLPGISEAVADRKFDEARMYIAITAAALARYAAGLDEATSVLTGS